MSNIDGDTIRIAAENRAIFCERGLVAGNAITSQQASHLSFVPNLLYSELLSIEPQNQQKQQEHVTHKIYCRTEQVANREVKRRLVGFEMFYS